MKNNTNFGKKLAESKFWSSPQIAEMRTRAQIMRISYENVRINAHLAFLDA